MVKQAKKKCLGGCGKTKPITEFYNTRSSFSSDGKTDQCKTCLTKNLDYNNIDTVLDILRIMDIPYIEETYLKVFEKYPTTALGNYLRQLNGMKQLLDKHYSDSVFLIDKNKKIEKEEIKNNDEDKELIKEYSIKWGTGYSIKTYESFENKLKLLEKDYNIKSSMHLESLMSYVRFRVMEEEATSVGDVKAAKDWGKLARDAATDANISPNKMKASELQDGLSTFSQLSLLVENAKDSISILPKLKKQPQDRCDFTLWQYINYIRRMRGLPDCEYEDIWKFYDERKTEYKDEYDFLSDEDEFEEDEEDE